jgi:pimeloyl-ACP methyl ester carboxylesterase
MLKTPLTPIARTILRLDRNNHVIKVTQWGTPLKDSKHVILYVGGMPTSAEEPALHNCVTKSTFVDPYESRKIHLLCIDKPGMGGSSFQYNFSIRKDWPHVVNSVLSHFNITTNYGIIGVSNGGPYAISCLLAHSFPEKLRVKAAAIVVGVSHDTWKSGYYSWSKPNTIFEGIFNSLPLSFMAPWNALALTLVNTYFMYLGGFERHLGGILPTTCKGVVSTILRDSAANFGFGAGLDCQQVLGMHYAPRDEHSSSLQNVTVPVTLWYGTKDATVPLTSAEWLHCQLPNSTLQRIPAGHELFWTHLEQVLDDLIENMTSDDSRD